MIGLPIMYLIIFIENISLIIKAYKKRKISSWVFLFIIEVVMIFIAINSKDYFDNLPTGNGFMAGLSHVGEYFASIGALYLYISELIVSFLAMIIMIGTKENNDNS